MEGPRGLLDQARSQLQGLLEPNKELRGNDRVVQPPRRAERAASMMLCAPWSEHMRANDNGSGVLVTRTTCVPPDPDFAAVVEQTYNGWSHLAGTTARMAIEV